MGVLDSELCGRLLVGRGSDVYDPVCVLPRGHSGRCQSEEELDASLPPDAYYYNMYGERVDL